MALKLSNLFYQLKTGKKEKDEESPHYDALLALSFNYYGSKQITKFKCSTNTSSEVMPARMLTCILKVTNTY